VATGRIQNRTLIQRAADVLNVEGVKRFPAILDLGDIKAVYVLGGESASAPSFSLGKTYNGNDSLDGLATLSQYITARSSDAQSPLYVNDDYALDLVGLQLEINFDAAGAALNNGRQMSLILARFQNYTSIDMNEILRLYPWQTIVAGTLVYNFGLASFNQGNTTVTPSLSIPRYLHIPKGDRLILLVSFMTGAGPFPANTFFNLTAHALTENLEEQTPH